MPDDDLQQPVRVSLVLFQIHRKAIWDLRAGAGMASMSRVLRNLIRATTPTMLKSMRQHFGDSGRHTPGALGRLTRPSLLIDAGDLDELDRLARDAKAPSRSAVARFLILNTGPGRPPMNQGAIAREIGA